MARLRAGLGPVLLAVSACSSLSDDTSWVAGVPSDSRISEATRRAGLAVLGTRSDDLGTEPWRAHDTLVFGIEAEKSEMLSSCLLVIELIPPEAMELQTADGPKIRIGSFRREVVLTWSEAGAEHKLPLLSDVWKARVQVRDCTGKTLAEADSQIFRELHRLGVLRYAAGLARFLADPTAKGDGATGLDTPALGMGVMLMLFQTLLDNTAMRSVLDELAAWPPWYKLPFLALNPHFTLGADFESAHAVANPLTGFVVERPLLEVPIRFTAAGTSLLELRATFTATDGPIGAVAGVLALVGYQPDEPARRFRMQLIGIRRGT